MGTSLTTVSLLFASTMLVFGVVAYMYITTSLRNEDVTIDLSDEDDNVYL